MLRSDISRRAFLLGTGAVILAACGGSDDDGTDTADGDTTTTAMHHHDDEFVPGVLSSDLYVSDQPQRIAFTVLRNDNGQPSAGQPAKIAFAPPGQEPTDFVDGVARFEGLPEFRGVYSVAAVLDTAGPWTAMLEYEGTHTEFAFQVNPKAQMPAIGAKAPTAASPTTDAPLGVDALQLQHHPRLTGGPRQHHHIAAPESRLPVGPNLVPRLKARQEPHHEPVIEPLRLGRCRIEER